jgi:hypothetical protein
LATGAASSQNEHRIVIVAGSVEHLKRMEDCG